MPIYRYQVVAENPGCSHCSPGFEVMQKMAETPLSECPQCQAPLRKVITPPNVASGNAHLSSPGHIEKHGFTQYRKVGKGVYEKTAGQGPDYISGD
jgi:putative FmdB family regulatory protein